VERCFVAPQHMRPVSRGLPMGRAPAGYRAWRPAGRAAFRAAQHGGRGRSPRPACGAAFNQMVRDRKSLLRSRGGILVALAGLLALHPRRPCDGQAAGLQAGRTGKILDPRPTWRERVSSGEPRLRPTGASSPQTSTLCSRPDYTLSAEQSCRNRADDAGRGKGHLPVIEHRRPAGAPPDQERPA
jgi:hypothetical protein